MSAGADVVGGGTEGQALDIKAFSPRVSHGDLIVFALALLLITAGGVVKQIHDNRTVSAEAGGVTVTYPRGWFRYPVEEPELIRAVSSDDGETTLLLFAAPAGPVEILEAVDSGISNPASSELGYSQLANEQIDLDGTSALRTDYAFVRTGVSSASPPEVIRGRQIAWLMSDRVYVLALESPDVVWEESSVLFDPIVEQLRF